MLTYAEKIEPRRIVVVHDLGSLDDTNQEYPGNQPPYIISYLTSQVPAKVLENALSPWGCFAERWLLFLIFSRRLENTQTSLFVSVRGLVVIYDMVEAVLTR